MKGIRVFLDNSLEIAIAVLRALAISCGVFLPAVVVGGIWAHGVDWWRWLATVAAVILTGAGAGVLGFYTFGNEEWRRGKADDRGTALRHD